MFLIFTYIIIFLILIYVIWERIKKNYVLNKIYEWQLQMGKSKEASKICTDIIYKKHKTQLKTLDQIAYFINKIEY